tara:strand:+ start:205 stop:603 length:399 start_codon:yes stop_codon:yes gene_type:complete
MKFKNPFQSAAEKVISTSEENKLYEKVTVAIENNDIDKGVWTKAFTQADGDTTKQKVIYIELMVEHYKNLIIAKQELEEVRAIEDAKTRERVAEESRKKSLEYKKRKELMQDRAFLFGLVTFFCLIAYLLAI